MRPSVCGESNSGHQKPLGTRIERTRNFKKNYFDRIRNVSQCWSFLFNFPLEKKDHVRSLVASDSTRLFQGNGSFEGSSHGFLWLSLIYAPRTFALEESAHSPSLPVRSLVHSSCSASILLFLLILFTSQVDPLLNRRNTTFFAERRV